MPGRTLHVMGDAAMARGDFTSSARLLSGAADLWRAEGRAGPLARALTGARSRIPLGDLARAWSDAGEGRALAGATGETAAWLSLTGTAALVATMRGDHDEAAGLVRDLRVAATVGRAPGGCEAARQAEGLRALLEGHAVEAYDIIKQLFLAGGPLRRWHVAIDLADAAAAAGEVEEARALLAELPAAARRLPSELLISARVYVEAVLTRDDGGHAGALAALPPGCVLARARLHLHHGRRLRRQRRYVDARESLRAAHDLFDGMGAVPWAEAARSQLLATGDSCARRRGETYLSAQETQIAELAARGLSNREIADRLFISHRTVGSHLYRVYPRLGITSRGQLAAALATRRAS
ncbi:LuxR C-terminal-related transcriptional regulator [Actinoplanes sp. NPDC000266]